MTWLNRGTLHLVTAADYWWLHALTAPPVLAANDRLLAQAGVLPDQAQRGVETIAASLEADGPLTQSQLRDRLRSAGVTVDGQAGYLLLARSGLRGETVRGPIVDGEQAYVLVDDWLGRRPPPAPRAELLAELARRYLRAHGPAAPQDLARWAGLGRRDATSALRALGDAITSVPGGGAGRVDLVDLVERAGRPSTAARLRPRLLGPFDPLMFGWVDRRPLLGGHDRDLVTRNGLFRPLMLAGDRAVGTWRIVRDSVVLQPLESLSDAQRRAFEREARDVERFLDGA